MFQKILRICLVLIITYYYSFSVNADENTLLCMPVKIDGVKQPVNFVMRVYDYVVSYQWDLDDTFCFAYRNQEGPVFINEYIPEGQDLKNWQQMFTIQAFYDSLVSNHQLINGYTSNKFSCKTYKYLIIQQKDDLLELVSVCGSYQHERLTGNKAISEISHYVIKKIGNTTYTFFHSKRDQPLEAAQYNFNNSDIKKWSVFLNKIELTPAKS